jgi:hypothetical protein
MGGPSSLPATQASGAGAVAEGSPNRTPSGRVGTR